MKEFYLCLALGAGVTANAQTASLSAPGHCQGNYVTVVSSVPFSEILWFVDGVFYDNTSQVSAEAEWLGTYTAFVVTPDEDTFAASNSWEIGANPDFDLEQSGSSKICDGDTVQFFVDELVNSAGVAYQWTRNSVPIPGATGISYNAVTGGAYNVTVTSAGGCSITANNAKVVTIKPTPVASISASGATTFCTGNSVILNGSSGSGYKYRWALDSNFNSLKNGKGASFTATKSGAYTLTTTIGKCSATSSPIQVTVGAPDAAITLTGSSEVCAQTGAVLSAAAGAGNTYQWLNGTTAVAGATGNIHTATTTGTYYVSVTDAMGCSAVTAKGRKIKAYQTPAATITPLGPTTIAQGTEVTLQANTASNYDHTWFIDGVEVMNYDDYQFDASVSGNYMVMVTYKMCSAVSAPVNVTVNSMRQSPMAVRENEACHVAVYPNPSEGLYQVDAPAEAQLVVMDVFGKLVTKQNAGNILDLTRLTNGIYLLQVVNEKGSLLKTEKLIKQ